MKFNIITILDKIILSILSSLISISLAIKYAANTHNWLTSNLKILFAEHFLLVLLALLLIFLISLQILSKSGICKKLWDKPIEYPENDEKIYLLIIILLTIIGFYLRFNHLSNLSFWADETGTAFAAISILKNGIPIFPSGLIYDRSILNTIFVALSTEIFGVNEFSGRLPSVLFGTLSIPIVYLFGKKFCNKNIGLGAAILVTFSTYGITWSMQTRMYAQLQFFYIASIYLFYVVFEEKKARYIPLFLAIFIGALLSHQFAYSLLIIFILYSIIFKSSAVVHVLIDQRDQLKNKWTILVFLLCLLSIRILWVLFERDLINAFSLVISTDINNFDYYNYFLLATYPIPYYLAIIGIVIGIILIIRRNKKGMLLSLLSFFIPFYIISYHLPEKFYRYLHLIMPIFFIFSLYVFGFAFESAKHYMHETKKNKNLLQIFFSNIEGIVIVAFVFLAIVIPSTAFTMDPNEGHPLEPDTPQPDYRAAFTYIKNNINSNDILILDLPNTMHAIYYMEDRNIVNKTYVLYEKKFVTSKNGSLFEVYSGAPILKNVTMFIDLVKSHNSGWVVLEAAGRTKETYDFIVQNMHKQLVTSPQVNLSSPLMSPTVKVQSTLEVYYWGKIPKTIDSVYSDNFDSDKWNHDKYSSYGIERSKNIIHTKYVLYPTVLDTQTYIKYNLDFSNVVNKSTIKVTGSRRDMEHNLSVWASQDNKTYTKIINFDKPADTTNQADITDYIENNQTWIDFRFFRSSKGENMPRILDFSITAFPKDNETVEITPFRNEGQNVSSREVSRYNPTNFLKEPSFEHYKDSDNPPIAWSFTSDNGAQAIVDTNASAGNYSFRTSVKNATSGNADLSQLFAINGSKYLFNVSYKQMGTGNSSALIQWMNAQGKEIGNEKIYLYPNTSWNRFSFEKYIPANTTQGKVILRYQTRKGDSGTVWFDDVQLYSARED